MEIEAVEASREQKGKSVKTADKSSPISAEIAAFEEKVKNSRSGEPQFGFYDSLAGSSWSVPVQRGVYITEEDRKRAGQRYMLQAASVRDLAEAQRLVQKLRSLGMEASYQSADPATGAGWYRVNVGPFDNVSRMNKAEDTLVSLRMMPLK
ncbi:MAG: SPOR domain-containing protein, partial [Pseudomonadota bacterium]